MTDLVRWILAAACLAVALFCLDLLYWATIRRDDMMELIWREDRRKREREGRYL